MPELIVPTTRLFHAWTSAHAEWGPGEHEDGFGLLPTDTIDNENGFAAWISRLSTESNLCTYRWIVDDERVLGGIALRHREGEFGHLGYGIRPSARRRGLATWALARMVAEAQSIGLDQVIAVCAADNLPSARTIEVNGGVLDAVVDTPLGLARRYVIQTAED